MTEQAQHQRRYFQPLQQEDFLRLEHAAYLKGLLKPFKGNGSLEDWANQCHALRDSLIALAQRRVLPQVSGYPFRLLPVELAQQTTGAGTTFLRWRKPDRSAMGVALWQAMMDRPGTPVHLLADLLALEHQRITLNMQISLLHSLGRQAHDCANKMAAADAAYQQRLAVPSITASADRLPP
uniref:DUF3158 family protein n=1 Tax=Marinobacterium profundum TaxID=1714300 RepID=UPI00082A6D7A|nr:DUF3158 family protein [Marinobacterium profundum]